MIAGDYSKITGKLIFEQIQLREHCVSERGDCAWKITFHVRQVRSLVIIVELTGKLIFVQSELLERLVLAEVRDFA